MTYEREKKHCLMQEAKTTYVPFYLSISPNHSHTQIQSKGQRWKLKPFKVAHVCSQIKNKAVYCPTTESSLVPHLGQPLYILQAENGVLIFHGKSFHSLPLFFKKDWSVCVGGMGCLRILCAHKHTEAYRWRHKLSLKACEWELVC